MGHATEIAGLTEHRLFDQRVAGIHRYTVTAGYAARAGDLFPAIPENAGMLTFPIAREGLVYTAGFTRLHALAAENALVRVLSVKRIRHVHRIGFRLIRMILVFDLQRDGRIVHAALPVVVVAHRAVQ